MVPTVLTLGPACWDPTTLGLVIERGHMGVARINYSHAHDATDTAFLREKAGLVRKISAGAGIRVPVFGDTPGWKFRLMSNFNPLVLHHGKQVHISSAPDPGCLVCPHPEYLELAEIGARIYVGDSNPCLRVIDKKGRVLICQTEFGDIIKPGKGLTIEGVRVSSLNLAPLADGDIPALRAAIEAGAEYLGMSYATRASQFQIFIDKARELGAPGNAKFVFKYELGEASEDLSAIVRLADVMYVGQGDLSLSVPYDEVPRHRQMVIDECRRQGKECWVGTGLLSSLVKGHLPSPGEVDGIVHVRRQGAHRLVLSDEFNSSINPAKSAEVLMKMIDFADRKASLSLHA
ncbi:MAG TPA: pyruvate kinase [Bryobacteraceae bacterium]|nr:pyruvate kinase [Bryobacteraceae bacterium]